MKPVLEGLEGRILLYTNTGNHFVYGSRITWSIEPDGTNLGSNTNNINATLNARFGQGNWQRAMQDAFAVWENVANINTVQVSDNGAPLDAGTLQQGSPYFGDIRIGSFALDPSVLGFTLLPPPSNGGSDSGEIILNSNQPWQMGSDYDLESVMIHEIGHALGLGHSTDMGAAMYAYYHGVQQYTDADDNAGIQSIWSARQEDGFAIGNSNFIPSNAVNVSSSMGPTDQIILGPLDVASSSESYWFKATTPSNASNQLQAVVQSSTLSELSPKVTIYDASLHSLWQASAPANSYGAIINASIFNATPNTTYYFKVSSSTSGPNGSGAYALLINMGNQNLTNFAPPNTQVQVQPDQGGGAIQELTNDTGVGASSISIVGPMSSLDNGYANDNGYLGNSGYSGEFGLLTDLGAWENIHNFRPASPSFGEFGLDQPELLTVGSSSYKGDFLLTTPPPALVSTAEVNPSVTAGALIPLDLATIPAVPTSVAVKRSATATSIKIFHPTGPL